MKIYSQTIANGRIMLCKMETFLADIDNGRWFTFRRRLEAPMPQISSMPAIRITFSYFEMRLIASAAHATWYRRWASMITVWVWRAAPHIQPAAQLKCNSFWYFARYCHHLHATMPRRGRASPGDITRAAFSGHTRRRRLSLFSIFARILIRADVLNSAYRVY